MTSRIRLRSGLAPVETLADLGIDTRDAPKNQGAVAGGTKDGSQLKRVQPDATAKAIDYSLSNWSALTQVARRVAM